MYIITILKQTIEARLRKIRNYVHSYIYIWFACIS